MAPGERELRKIWWAAIHRATLDYFSCNELVGREAIRAQESAARWFFRSDQGDLNSFENILALLGDNPETWRKKLMRPETEQIVKQKYLNSPTKKAQELEDLIRSMIIVDDDRHHLE